MIAMTTDKGEISIATEVFTNLAGDAATKCFGVKGMAGRAKENGLYQLLRRESMSKGVTVQLNEDNSVSISLHIVVDYGVNLVTICQSIMSEVSYKVASATGVPVHSVDVFVDAVQMN